MRPIREGCLDSTYAILTTAVGVRLSFNVFHCRKLYRHCHHLGNCSLKKLIEKLTAKMTDNSLFARSFRAPGLISSSSNKPNQTHQAHGIAHPSNSLTISCADWRTSSDNPCQTNIDFSYLPTSSVTMKRSTHSENWSPSLVWSPFFSFRLRAIHIQPSAATDLCK